MRFTSALLVLAYAFHAPAWRFDIQSMFENGPLTFLRRPSHDNQAAAEEVEPQTLPRHNAFRDRQLQLSNFTPCSLDDIRTIGACLCAEARDLEGVRFTLRDTALCTSLLQLEPELWRPRCNDFTDSNGNVQRYRLVHVAFNTLAECKPERVQEETKIARSAPTIPPTPKPSKEPPTPPPSEEPPTPTPSKEPPTPPPSEKPPTPTPSKEPPTPPSSEKPPTRTPSRKPPTPKPSKTSSTTPSPSSLPSVLPSASASPSNSNRPSTSPSKSPRQETPSLTPTPSLSMTPNPSKSPSMSPRVSVTPTPSNSRRPSRSPSMTPTTSSSLSPRISPSSSPSPSKKRQSAGGGISVHTAKPSPECDSSGDCYKSGSKPVVERQATVKEVSTSDCTGEECNTSAVDGVRASAMQPQVIISGLRMYMEGLTGIGDDLTSGTAEELTSPMTYVESRVRQTGGLLLNKRRPIFGVLEVVTRVGVKVVGVLTVRPSPGRAVYRKSMYRIECNLKIGKLARAVLTGRKVELMMNNMVEVEVPLTAVKDDSHLDGTDRQRRRRVIVGVAKCKPKKRPDGRVMLKCECRKKGRGKRGKGGGTR